jgi:hypothetical protein
MNCPNCGSNNVQRLQVIFENGTQHITAHSETLGVSFSSSSEGAGGALTTTTGISQSIIAQKASPPKKKTSIWPVISIVFGLIGFLIDLPYLSFVE